MARASANVGRVELRRTLNLTGQLFEGLALRLGNQESREDARKHEDGVNLHDVVEPGRGRRPGGSTTGAKRSNENLGNNGTDLAGGRRNTVGAAAVAGREAFARDDESGRVRAYPNQSPCLSDH